MISSLIDPEVENKLKSLLNDFFFPLKCYLIIILLLLVLLNYNLVNSI